MLSGVLDPARLCALWAVAGASKRIPRSGVHDTIERLPLLAAPETVERARDGAGANLLLPCTRGRGKRRKSFPTTAL